MTVCEWCGSGATGDLGETIEWAGRKFRLCRRRCLGQFHRAPDFHPYMLAALAAKAN